MTVEVRKRRIIPSFQAEFFSDRKIKVGFEKCN